MTKHVYVISDNMGPLTAFTDKRQMESWVKDVGLQGDSRIAITRVMEGSSIFSVKIDSNTFEVINE